MSGSWARGPSRCLKVCGRVIFSIFGLERPFCPSETVAGPWPTQDMGLVPAEASYGGLALGHGPHWQSRLRCLGSEEGVCPCGGEPRAGLAPCVAPPSSVGSQSDTGAQGMCVRASHLRRCLGGQAGSGLTWCGAFSVFVSDTSNLCPLEGRPCRWGSAPRAHATPPSTRPGPTCPPVPRCQMRGVQPHPLFDGGGALRAAAVLPLLVCFWKVPRQRSAQPLAQTHGAAHPGGSGRCQSPRRALGCNGHFY